MIPDPKWLEILKASGWQTTALAAACGIFLWLIHIEILPKPDNPIWIWIPTIAFLICAGLALAAIGAALNKYIKPAGRFGYWLDKRRAGREAGAFIPYMTEKDKEIIGYLLFHDQKMFTSTQDAGYAAPLIARRIIILRGVPNQIVGHHMVPFEIPDHIWDVLNEHRDQFPYTPPRNGQEVHPWVIPWQLQ